MNRTGKILTAVMALVMAFGITSLAWAGAQKVTREDGMLAREEEIDEAFVAEEGDDDTGGNSNTDSKSNDNTGSRHTSVSRDNDRSRGDNSRDRTRDGGDRTRDRTGNKTNDGTRNDTR